MAILIQQLVRLDATFRNRAGALTDPTAVYLLIKTPQPNGGEYFQYVYNSGDNVIVRVNTGMFYANFTPTVAGKFEYRWESTGTAQAAGESSFSVDSSVFYAKDGQRYPQALP